MRYKTKTDGPPTGLPKVYIACHPEDFSCFFDPLCKELYNAHDCAVYYGEDLSVPTPEEELERCNLLVVPVSYRLLSSPCPAMTVELPFAQKKKIPVLPIMMEQGLVSLFNATDIFSGLQYLDATDRDTTKLPYPDKLKKYLGSVLISDELAQRVRDAFDAYIFLSYRKMDRGFANELMRLIHRRPEYRDIAIWYDEYLTPGESFRTNIQKCLERSRLFTLLVTPNILESSNFVMAEEYPRAKTAGLPILPVEMAPTDKAQLVKNFDGIPPCVDPHDEAVFTGQLLDALERMAITKNDADPVHNFLIGLAYTDGIDVEIDRERGMALITDAAEAGLAEAMEHLYELCCAGAFPELPQADAAKWAKRLADHYQATGNEEQALFWQNNLAMEYREQDRYREALVLQEHVCRRTRQLFRDDPQRYCTTLINLSTIYQGLGQHQQALALQKEAHEFLLSIGRDPETDPDVLGALNRIASTYRELYQLREALALQEDIYRRCCVAMGPLDPRTASVMHELADTYLSLDRTEDYLRLEQEAYEICLALPEMHMDRLGSLLRFALACLHSGDPDKALELQQLLQQQCSHLPASHPMSREASKCLRDIRQFQGRTREAISIGIDIYENLSEDLGPYHLLTLEALTAVGRDQLSAGDLPEAELTLLQAVRLYRKHHGNGCMGTIQAISALAELYRETGDDRQYLRFVEESYRLSLKHLGRSNPNTMTCIGNYALALQKLGKTARSVTLVEEALRGAVSLLGPEHTAVEEYRKVLFTACILDKQYKKALTLAQKLYDRKSSLLGPEHPEVLEQQINIAFARANMGQLQESFDRLLELTGKLCDRLPSGDPLLLSTLQDMTRICRQIRQQQAPENWSKLLQLQQRALPPAHPLVLESLDDLALICNLAGRYGEAALALEQLLTQQRRTLSPGDPQIRSTEENLALMRRLQAKNRPLQ